MRIAWFAKARGDRKLHPPRVNKRSKGHRWTDDDVRQLTNLAARGLSVDAIARAPGRTVPAVRTKAAHHRLRLLGNSTSGPERQRLPWERGERPGRKTDEV